MRLDATCLDIFKVARPLAFRFLKQVTDWVELRRAVDQDLISKWLPKVSWLIESANLFAAIQSEYLDLSFYLTCQDDSQVSA